VRIPDITFAMASNAKRPAAQQKELWLPLRFSSWPKRTLPARSFVEQAMVKMLVEAGS
jgi:hypothetical protein